jgi:GNAT superfamily N-acetyltransferase
MGLQFTSALPAIDSYWKLYECTGWNDDYRLSPQAVAAALAGSWYAVSAYDGERLVGFGRVLTDGVMHSMIYDLIVAPDFQGHGIGTSILDMLVQKCRNAGIYDIQLFCARGKRAFYEKRGFVSRPEEAPGMEFQPAGDPA